MGHPIWDTPVLNTVHIDTPTQVTLDYKTLQLTETDGS